MKEILEKKYNALQKLCKQDASMANADISFVLKKAICTFMEQCKRPAIWCYGKHTRMLMADFMFELKKVRYIIDKGTSHTKDSGFEIIGPDLINEKKIDGVLISSRIYKDEIADELKKNYGNIKYLDIYAEFENAGIYLDRDYYAAGHPYCKYRNLNKMQRNLLQEKDGETYQAGLKKIIQAYIEIKDFRSAIQYTEKLLKVSNSAWENLLLQQLKEIYSLQMEAMDRIDENNVVMLCVDGLRRKDVFEKHLKNLYGLIKDKMYYFNHAYSLSTSTYESLIPAYSENDDLRTRYYETNKVPGENCRFICEAKRQNRRIFFYTDGTDYIEDPSIKVTGQMQLAAEKLWDFVLDAADEKNGLFYIHILYESHFSYPNPYTTDKIVADGSNILFDYLQKNKGRLRTDYRRQQRDALKYLDDTIIPLIERLHCRMVLYADHGNILIDKGTDISDIESTKYTFHEDLIQVPLAVSYPDIKAGIGNSLISIMELNNIVIMLLNQREIQLPEKDFVKVVRSEIYNPDFRYLYKKTNNGHGLLAFEVFIFKEGYKLAVYADGTTELYLAGTDKKVDDMQCRKKLLDRIRDRITVCDLNKIA